MPDVIIWMISGSERIAYYRIPAYDVMFFTNPDACGKLCGKTVELKLKVRNRHSPFPHRYPVTMMMMIMKNYIVNHQSSSLTQPSHSRNRIDRNSISISIYIYTLSLILVSW
jgi:hypothetical protein